MTGTPLTTLFADSRNWRLLLVYNFYRMLSILVFAGVYFPFRSQPISAGLYYLLLGFYFIFALMFMYFCSKQKMSFSTQVLLSGTMDILVITGLLSALGILQSGFGILLNVTIAALSILAPGRLAIYFASLATCILLGGSLAHYFHESHRDLSIFFYSGIYGAGFFATALTAWSLAHWVQLSERLAQHRSRELQSLQRINGYIVERLYSGVIYVKTNGEIKLVNRAAIQFFKREQGEAIQHLQQLSSLLHEKFLSFLRQSQNDIRTAQTTMPDPLLNVYFFTTAIENDPAVLILLDDMSLVAQQAQQLKLASLGRFSASIAHELRNPLGTIAHAAQLLGDGGELTEDDARLKEMIMNNCHRMNGVIKNVLQLSRREQSKPEAIDMKGFLEQFKQYFCLNNACKLFIDLDKLKNTVVIFDKSQLEQVLVILCENAMQHGADARGRVKITISVRQSARETVLTVSDCGAGVEKGKEHEIFEPFYTTRRTGTGMGLFIARDLCEINQGRLTLEERAKGCCFAILINTVNELIL